MRDKKTIDEKSVYVTLIDSEDIVHIIPEGIFYCEVAGWVLNSYNVKTQKEEQIRLSNVDIWEEINDTIN